MGKWRQSRTHRTHGHKGLNQTGWPRAAQHPYRSLCSPPPAWPRDAELWGPTAPSRWRIGSRSHAPLQNAAASVECLSASGRCHFLTVWPPPPHCDSQGHCFQIARGSSVDLLSTEFRGKVHVRQEARGSTWSWGRTWVAALLHTLFHLVFIFFPT